MEQYEWAYSAHITEYQPVLPEGWVEGQSAQVKCHYPWCPFKPDKQPLCPMCKDDPFKPVVKRTFWDCGTHLGGEERMAVLMYDLLLKYDHDKAVREQVGQPYSKIIKERVVSCADVSEAPGHCPAARVFFVIQWTEMVSSSGRYDHIGFPVPFYLRGSEIQPPEG